MHFRQDNAHIWCLICSFSTNCKKKLQKTIFDKIIFPLYSVLQGTAEHKVLYRFLQSPGRREPLCQHPQFLEILITTPFNAI